MMKSKEWKIIKYPLKQVNQMQRLLVHFFITMKYCEFGQLNLKIIKIIMMYCSKHEEIHYFPVLLLTIASSLKSTPNSNYFQ